MSHYSHLIQEALSIHFLHLPELHQEMLSFFLQRRWSRGALIRSTKLSRRKWRRKAACSKAGGQMQSTAFNQTRQWPQHLSLCGLLVLDDGGSSDSCTTANLLIGGDDRTPTNPPPPPDSRVFMHASEAGVPAEGPDRGLRMGAVQGGDWTALWQGSRRMSPLYHSTQTHAEQQVGLRGTATQPCSPGARRLRLKHTHLDAGAEKGRHLGTLTSEGERSSSAGLSESNLILMGQKLRTIIRLNGSKGNKRRFCCG
ncbi:hypothetical protein AOLI_G00120530 [Acnodon oligacanthus]